jgi:hypothetical protein
MANRPGAGKVIARAATGWLNLGVLGAAGVAAAALVSWPIAAIGGVAYAALVASDVSNPDFRRKVLRERPALQNPKQLFDPQQRAAAAVLAERRVEVERALAAAPERVRRSVAGSLGTLEELAAHTATVIARADDLARYLARADVDKERIEAARLAAEAAACGDDATRRDLEEAAKAAAEKLATIEQLVTARKRAHANLARVNATLGAIPAKIVRMRTLDDQATDAFTGDVGGELDRMNTDLRAFEDTLVSLVEAAPT